MTRGRIPQEGSINRNQPTVEWVEVENVPYTSQKGKPKIAPTRIAMVDGEPTEVEWTTDALQWWKVVSTMPHCVLWTPSEWQFAKATMVLADNAFRGDTRAFGELRQREAKLGTTREARQALRIRYIEPTPIKDASDIPTEPVVDDRKSRKSRLLGSE